MPKLRRLGGRDLITVFKQFGFELISQRGSHAKLVRITASTRQVLTVPLHHELDVGTLKAVYRQPSRFVPEEDLHPHFYST